MADPLYELLTPYLHPAASLDAATASYLARLPTLPLAALALAPSKHHALAASASEHHALAHSAHSLLRSLQSLSKRSHSPIVAATAHLARLAATLAHLAQHARAVHAELPALETAAQRFADKYRKTADSAVLARRRQAMLLSRTVDRLTDVLDLPALLATAVSSSTAASHAAPSPASSNANHATALDLYAHIKRLHTLYPASPLVSSLATQAEQEMKTMAANLIASLQPQSIKLAGAMRTIGWLRRVAPELDDAWTTRQTTMGSGEGSLGALFLVCRLTCLESMLGALDPLRELADHESERRLAGTAKGDAGWAAGQQTDKYLKKYLDIFREQSFAIISMYKSIFPSALPGPGSDESAPAVRPVSQSNPLQPIPSALATFPLHLVQILFDTLRTYLPNVQDHAARDSLLTQVLYCAGSLGRLGGDFSMMIALLEEDVSAQVHHAEATHARHTQEEWVQVMKKHRVQASRLELLASGVGAGRTSSLSRNPE
ncbi:Dor1-like family-domain-containing protein [Ampelomyces quisqualis]|uniref:Conserved oligomeric Golgi complex subunit 8 n=1 Tax=Ampelomyces quisqualis TaxID=50730 RepID=A0A6A5QS38_AMPQU|nr:Dor1-like family-domain-containing protein [Ampelomyces quisqualis]